MNEADLIEQMKLGNKEAFDEIYERYNLKLLRTAVLITGNRSDGEDITQEAFVTCYLHIHELKNAERFSSWIYQKFKKIIG